MFGQQSDQPKHDDAPVDQPADAVVSPDTDQSGAAQAPQPTWQHPGAPLGGLGDDQPAAATPSAPTAPSDDALPTHHDNLIAPAGSTDDLVAIKQQALTQLSPLVGHLDQTPEEKFRTTMMMIQASDDQSLVKTAYEAAQQITDEKTRAQALLDIVNEINYFTQHTQS
ncbi:MAG: hypothetical protein JWL89_611 [Candidatus Saccharibacteria bacterium]|nr:hypothetical protein [Candidatus Saccharibacteria bacterium]